MKTVHLLVWLGCSGIVGGAISQGEWLTAGLAAVAAIYANIALGRALGGPRL